MINNNKSHKEWLEIHNRAARDYITSEWSREVLFGVGNKRKRLFSRAAGNVLDVGCGYGINFPHLINATHITGIDFSPVMLEKAHETARRSKVPVELREGDAEAGIKIIRAERALLGIFHTITASPEKIG